MDVQMPEMDGLTASRKIREKEIETGAHIPIVAMTAHAMKGDKERCLAAGMDGYITKPVSRQDIEETIATVLVTEERTPISAVAPNSPFSWDSTTALRQMDGDESLLQELIQIFMEELPLHLANLNMAVETEDMETLERTAHSLKGELSCLGLTGAAQKARDLERMGRERTLQPAAELLSAFKTEMTAVTSAMRDMLYAGR
jgi:CheY-like chemotaxis protein